MIFLPPTEKSDAIVAVIAGVVVAIGLTWLIPSLFFVWIFAGAGVWVLFALGATPDSERVHPHAPTRAGRDAYYNGLKKIPADWERD